MTQPNHSTAYTNRAHKDLYQAVTDRIITALESGTPPWKQPWRSVEGQAGNMMPCNAITGRRYSGVNVLLLWIASAEYGFRSHRWLTYRQAEAAGGHVRKGELANFAILFKPFQVELQDKEGHPLLDEQGQPIQAERAFIKHMPLFNIEQCDGLPDSIKGTPPSPLTDSTPPQTDEGAVDTQTFNRVMAIINQTGVNFLSHPQNHAFYRPATDQIVMPEHQQFFTEADYWSTVLHELTHATGHPLRLNRAGITSTTRRFGDTVYGFEELIAEIGSAFLCTELGIFGDVQHESYLSSWLKTLKEDKHAIFRASRFAREAFEYLIDHNSMAQQSAA
ncbi:zincin-like metallopeptidase domain-containing protein [Yersinia enterocolitica]|uniref:ArdC family protein n=1 Tax=Yersinia massiliensis TaxID=419257 RepID=UPI001CFCB0E0|nr:zincin-like metallopeptidase domain-containing protein [Yersinia massiliensis]MCB5308773.1 ssDNA-binding domain-containing protein [Yersinia massiliensis]